MVATFTLGLTGSQPADAAKTIAVELVSDGLTAPNLVATAHDGSGRLFVADQPGQVWIIDATSSRLPTPLLDITSKLVPLGAFGPGSFDERGLLGLAFHPGFESNGRFFVTYSAPQPPPLPITFEFGTAAPDDVTFTGGFVGSQGVLSLYCSGARSFEVAANQMATIEFDQPVIETKFFFVHRTGTGAGAVTAVLADGSTIGPQPSNQATSQCDPDNFVTIQDLNFPVIGIKRLELQAGNGSGLILFLDDLEVTRFDHKSRVSEFIVPASTPNQADAGNERIILEIDQPQFNHNAGMLAFGPQDGYLYISVGDGGNGSDVGPFHNAESGNAQDITNLLGTILRIDVDGDDFPDDALRNYAIPPDNPFATTPGCADGCDEIWAYGLRNPFRYSFDMEGTHELFCGDAGQELFEGISIIRTGDNLGWNIKEGLHCFDPTAPFNPPGSCPGTGARGETLVDPIIEYPHFQNLLNLTGPIGQAVIGGNIYRGTAFPGLEGMLVFGDFSLPPFGGPPDGSIFLGMRDPVGTWTRTQPAISNGTAGRLKRFVMGFGQDDNGEVYVCTNTSGTPFGTSGAVFRLVASKSDLDGNGDVDLTDFVDLLRCFGGPNQNIDPDCNGDLNDDAKIDLRDVGEFQRSFTGR